jgi:hypothetical protein
MPDLGVYPGTAAARDRFVLERRGVRPAHDPWRSQGLIVEDERAAQGGRDRIATVFLTGRECPWRCAMCDLWTYTTTADTPRGAIPAQVAAARAAVRGQAVPVTGMKLYNAGSFFDPRAVPEDDYDEVAEALSGLSRVIVESHPALVGPRVDRLLTAFDRHRGPEAPAPQLEVAMGLETANPAALDLLNKRFTLEDFAQAARALDERGVALRVFLLISPPFIHPREQVDGGGRCGPSPAAPPSSRWCLPGRAMARSTRWRTKEPFACRISTTSSAASRWPSTMRRTAAGCSSTSGISNGSRRAPPAPRRAAIDSRP